MNKVKGLLIGAGVGVLSAFGIAGGLVAFGEWTAYASEYTYAGLKFAGETDSGCGLELPTELGRDAGLTVLYCEHENGWSFIPEHWYTTYYVED